MTQSQDQKPSTVLRSEHRVILRVLGVLDRLVARAERGAGFEDRALQRCVEFFRLFADACHHAKEEDLLFPVLEQRGIPREGGPIGVMLDEHQVARQLTKRMGAELAAHAGGDVDATQRFIEAARQYHGLLTNHIFKEDNVLFEMGDRIMTANDQHELCASFGEVGCRAFEGKRREELKQVADELEQSWPPS